MIISFLKKVEYQIDVDEVATDIAFNLDDIMDEYLSSQVDEYELDDIKDNMLAKDYEILVSTIMQRALDIYCDKVKK